MQNTKLRYQRWLIMGVIGLNLGLAISYVMLWAIQAKSGNFWRADFSEFYTGWAIVRDGLGNRLYDLDLQTNYQQTILEGRSFIDGLLPFNYPPHMALYFSPLAKVSLSTAFTLWTLAECILLVWLLKLVLDFTYSWKLIERLLAISGILSFPALFYNFMLGALSLLLLICLWQYYLTLKGDHDGQSGIWLAAVLIKPQNIILPGVLLCAARRWKAVACMVIAGCFIFLTSSAGLGWHIWLDFINLLRKMNNLYGVMGVDPTGMYNFKGLLTSIFGTSRGNLINELSWTALAASMLVTLWIWRGAWTTREAAFELRMAFTLLMGLFFNLHLFPQDSLIIVLPIILYYHYLRKRKVPYRSYAVFILLCPSLFLISEFTIRNKLGVHIPVLAMMILMVWMANSLYKESKYGNR